MKGVAAVGPGHEFDRAPLTVRSLGFTEEIEAAVQSLEAHSSAGSVGQEKAKSPVSVLERRSLFGEREQGQSALG